MYLTILSSPVEIRLCEMDIQVLILIHTLCSDGLVSMAATQPPFDRCYRHRATVYYPKTVGRPN